MTATYKNIIPQLVCISLLLALSIDIYLPALPDIAKLLHATQAQTQMTISVFIAGFSVGQLIYGPLSDIFGRKPILLLGLSIYLLGSLICFIAPSIYMLMTGRLIQGVGACVGPITAFAMIRDIYQKENCARNISYITTSMSFSPIVAPILGSYLQYWLGWRSHFLFLSFIDVILIITTLKWLPETVIKNNNTKNIILSIKNYASILSNKKYWLYIVCLTGASSMLFSFIAFAPFLFINTLQLSTKQFSLLFAMNAVALILGGSITVKLTKNWNTEKIILIAGIIGLVGGCSMLILSLSGMVSILMICPMFICSISIAMTVPSSIAGAINYFPACAGSASAMASFLRYTGASTIIFITGFIHVTNHLLLSQILVVSSLCILSACFCLTLKLSIITSKEKINFDNA